MDKLIKIDRNGSKHWEGLQTCDRCGGTGVYAQRVENGKIVPHWAYNGVCLKCGGDGKVIRKWIERTPEYQAKLDAKRDAKRQKWFEDHADEIAQRNAEIEARKAEKERREAEYQARLNADEARKQNSQYVGSVGDKICMDLTFNFMASFQVRSFYGGSETMHIYNFIDEDGNTFVWKTQNCISKQVGKCEWIDPQHGDKISVKGSIKEHNEYKGEKQTILTRCKVTF